MKNSNYVIVAIIFSLSLFWFGSLDSSYSLDPLIDSMIKVESDKDTYFFNEDMIISVNSGFDPNLEIEITITDSENKIVFKESIITDPVFATIQIPVPNKVGTYQVNAVTSISPDNLITARSSFDVKSLEKTPHYLIPPFGTTTFVEEFGYQIPITIQGGEFGNFLLNAEKKQIRISLTPDSTFSSSSLKIEIPRKILDSKKFILSDVTEDIDFIINAGCFSESRKIIADEVESSDQSRTLQISIPPPLRGCEAHTLDIPHEFFMTPISVNIQGTEIYLEEEEVILSPKKQVRSGVEDQDVVCKENLQLIFKQKIGSPACVKPLTAQKLFERGWGS